MPQHPFGTSRRFAYRRVGGRATSVVGDRQSPVTDVDLSALSAVLRVLAWPLSGRACPAVLAGDACSAKRAVSAATPAAASKITVEDEEADDPADQYLPKRI